MDRKRQRFEKQGLLAIEPRAFFDMFFEAEAAEPFEMHGDVAVVSVEGPLDHHAGWWCDNYDDIYTRVCSAFESPAKSIVLRMDSPGGVVSGLYDCARRIRAKAKESNKPLVAYIEGMGCSAAYALAASASRIVCSDSAIVGSIGVLDCRVDVTAMDAKDGIAFSFITSGARKADGHPHKAFTPEELADKQLIVDHLAGLFFDWVKEARGIDAKPLDARIFVGTASRDVGLVDDVSTFESLLATIASGGTAMATKLEEAKSALEDAAKGEGEDAEKAKKMLKVLFDDGETESDEDDEGKAESEDEEKDPPPSDDDDEEDDEMEGDSKAAATTNVNASASTSVDLAAKVTELAAKVAKLEGSNDASERANLFASRPDLPKDLVEVLRDKPFAEVKAIVSALPRKGTKREQRAAEATVKATLGEGQNGDPTSVPQQSPEAAERMRERMGLSTVTRGIKQNAYKLELGAVVPNAAGKGK